MTAQDHFSGIKNSNGFSLLSSSMNPAELSILILNTRLIFSQQVLMLQI
jgi:hypothetical protein